MVLIELLAWLCKHHTGGTTQTIYWESTLVGHRVVLLREHRGTDPVGDWPDDWTVIPGITAAGRTSAVLAPDGMFKIVVLGIVVLIIGALIVWLSSLAVGHGVGHVRRRRAQRGTAQPDRRDEPRSRSGAEIAPCQPS